MKKLLLLAVSGLLLLSCSTRAPKTKEYTITEYPILVHEQQDMLPYLQQDFADNGVLSGKEVYGFYPSTIVVHSGDMIHLNVINPADDGHTMSIPDINMSMVEKPHSTTPMMFTAPSPGIYDFYCAEAEHAPYMWGQIVVIN